MTARLFRANKPPGKKKAGRLMPGLQTLKWLRGSDWNRLTTFGPSSALFAGLAKKMTARLFRANKPPGKKKAGRLMPGLQILKWLRGSDLN